jgi:sarcosine oxidase
MTLHADVLILGTGGVGSAATFHAARRGLRVIGIDRFPGGHDRGSSHGQSRIIRLAYFEHPDYVPLLQRAYANWDELERLQNERLFFRVGLLEAGVPEGATIHGILTAARLHNLAVESLDPATCRTRYPGFRLPEHFAAVFEKDAGYLLVERCVLTHLEQARRAGAQLVVGETIQSWSAQGGRVTVRTDRETYEADRLIVTAGAWAGRLLGDLGVPLQVRRKHLHWYPAPRHPYHADAGCPTFLFETAPEETFYGFPDIDGRGLKVAEHSGGAIIADPLTDDRGVEPEDRRRVEAFLSAYLPGVGRPARDHCVCHYTMSPDGHFLVDRHPRHPEVAFAAGLSGHGFKFTSVLGEVLVELAIDSHTRLPIDFLSLRRLAK